MLVGAERSPKALWLLAPAVLLYLVAFVAPMILVVVFSFAKFKGGVTTLAFLPQNYVEAATDEANVRIFLQTVRLALTVTAACLVAGLFAASAIRRATPKIRMLMMALVVAPLLTSIIVRNVSWLLILGRNGLINDLLVSTGLIQRPLPLLFNAFAVVLAAAHVYLPFMVLPIYASLRAIDPSLEEGASSLGASSASVFLRITLPLSMPGILAGSTLVFILSMGLYLTPLIMGGGFVVTLPMIITNLVRDQYNWPEASALSVLLLLFILLVAACRTLLQARWRKAA